MPICYSDYPSNWKEISKYIRFTRAHNMCEECGAVNYEPHPITKSKVILTVAHLNHNPRDCVEDNLKALCQRCHLKHDLPEHIFNRKYGRKAKELNLKLPGII